MVTQTRIGKKTIYFDDEKHKFWDEAGQTIKSVTHFTGIIDKSGALIGWAVKLYRLYLEAKLENGEQITILDVQEGAKQHRIKKEEAADLGSAIHALAEKWIKKQPFEVPGGDDEASTKIRNGFDAFLKFQKEHKFKWLASEMTVYSPKHNYAGILDALAFDQEGKLALVDFKSSNGIYTEMYLQVGGYQQALEEMLEIKDKETAAELKKLLGKKKKIDYRIIIKFGKETGDFEYRILNDGDRDIKGFLSAVGLRNAIDAIEAK